MTIKLSIFRGCVNWIVNLRRVHLVYDRRRAGSRSSVLLLVLVLPGRLGRKPVKRSLGRSVRRAMGRCGLCLLGAVGPGGVVLLAGAVGPGGVVLRCLCVGLGAWCCWPARWGRESLPHGPATYSVITSRQKIAPYFSHPHNNSMLAIPPAPVYVSGYEPLPCLRFLRPLRFPCHFLPRPQRGV